MQNKTRKRDQGRLALRVPKEFLTVAEVAKALKISNEAARRLYCRGTLFGKRERDVERGGNPVILVHRSSVKLLLEDEHYKRARRRGEPLR